MSFTYLKFFNVANRAQSSVWTDMEHRQVSKASFKILFIYLPIFTNT